MSDLSRRIAALSPEKQALLTRRLREKQEAQDPAICRRADPERYPLSYAQQRLWFLDQFEPDSPFYNIMAPLKLTGPLHTTALKQSLQEIIRRHEVLRTNFITQKGHPVQVIRPECDTPLPVTDLRHLPREAQEAEVKRLAAEESRRAFNLKTDPLLRASLLRLDEETHIIFLTMHHIVSDGWSTGVFVQEIAVLYEALCDDCTEQSGRSSLLPDLPIQYADYAAWQQQWLQGDRHKQQLAYWQQKLSETPPILELPTDRPRPPVQTYRGTHHHLLLPAPLAQKIQALSQETGTTLFMTLLAAFHTLLYRYTGQNNINVGVPVANRRRVELEQLIGFFVNTLVINARFDDQPSFRTLLQQVRETTLEAFAHQDVPFETLVETLQPERNMSHTPLFQVMFDLQKAPPETWQLGDLQASLLDLETGTAKFDLLLMALEKPGALALVFEYNTDLFDAATIERMGGHLLTLLTGIAAKPDQSIATLPLLTEAEQRQMLVEWNRTDFPYPHDSTFSQLFEEQVERASGETAVIYKNHHLTYDQLNRRANQLAHHLQQLGARPDTLIGLSVERSLELIVGIVGILKAGAAYLPLDPTYPHDRLAFMMEDAGVQILVTQQHHLANLPAGGLATVCLDSDWETIAQQPGDTPPNWATPDSLAYVIYTSGSTGKPKGAMIQHRSLLHLATGLHQTVYDGNSGARYRLSLNAPISFDASVQQIVMLLYGHALHIIPNEARQDGRALLAFIRRHKLDVFDCVPSQLKLLLAAGLLDGSDWVPAKILPGGEAIDEATWRVLAAAPHTEFYNMYGPTECTVDSTVSRVRTAGHRPTIGRPLPNNRLYILDSNDQPVPIGVPGHLHIGGAGVGHGYLNRPELTREKFILNSFTDSREAEEPGNGGDFSLLRPKVAHPRPSSPRLYRTGDLCRYLPDGNVEFLGRIDHQVKVNGFRMELGEIEAALKAHPEVNEAVTLAREDVPGHKRLVAYIVPESGRQPTVTNLRRHLKDILPEYMIPSAYVTLAAFPLTPNGKIDRRALPAPDQARPDLEKPYVPPRTALESYLASLWQEMLQIDKTGVHDNFFELGGNSIKAAVLINRFQEETGTAAHVKAIFLAPTIAEMAVYIHEYYPEIAARIDAAGPSEEQTHRIEADLAADDLSRWIDTTAVAQMRQLLPSLPPRRPGQIKPDSKNRRAIFILSPPRSGSTLLRVMLAGHPQLFAPPELDLLSFNTLAERQAAFAGPNSFWLEGAIRAVMEVENCEVAQAEAIMAGYESQNLTTKQFYRLLQDGIGDKILVDKTPVYPLDPAILARMEEDFADALYIHLVRHPYASIYSFIEARLDQVFFRHKHPFSRRELAELVWIVSHQNILAFLQTIPAGRQLFVRFEDLVTQPDAVMADICRFVGIGFEEALLRPYQGQRMTDGLRPGMQMVGDLKFYLRQKIDPKATDRWRKFHTVDFLSDVGQQLGRSLGYELKPAALPLPETPGMPHSAPDSPNLQPLSRDKPLPLSFAQQRLWFLDQMEPGNPFYNIPAAVRLTGSLNVTAIEASFNEVIRRHELLRTAFETVDGKPQLTVAPALWLSIPLVDLVDLPKEEREAAAQRLMDAEAQRPFTLSQPPLLRITLYRMGDTDHLILFTIHHIIADGWSINVLVQELATLYAAFAAERPSPLAELPIQYADYAWWQRQWLQGELVAGQVAYWKQQLTGQPPILELPLDHPRPAVQTFQGATHWFNIGEELQQKLEALSRHEGVTFYTTLLAAFQTLLYRYTGQEDVSVGTPIANRNRAELENLIGFFVNTLVMRSDLSGAPSFRKLMGRVQETAVAAYTNQDVPFEMLVDELQPQRNMSHTPLFQVMFALQNAPESTPELPGLIMTPVAMDNKTAKFDLTLALTESKEGLHGALEYNTALFEPDTIARMAGHFQTLLNGIVANPDQSIATLPLLTEAELQQILVEWNDTAVSITDLCAHQLFEQQVERTPEATAVQFQNQTLTYDQLNRRANQLARHLHTLGVGPESIVALNLPRSLELIIAMLGVLKAGGAYLPLDPTYPPDRLAFMIEDAQPAVILTSSRVFESSSSQVVNISSLETDYPTTGLQDYKTTPDSSAYIIYTSGSTGQPKGVLLRHRGLVNLAQAYIRLCQVKPGSRVLQFFSASFDGSVADIFMTLLGGGTLCLADGDALLPGPGLARFLQEQAISTAVLPPSALTHLPTSDYPALQTLLTGGESCTREIVNRWSPGRRFINVYGPTEATVVSTWYEVDASLPPEATNIPIGRPLANTQAYILDKQQQPVPIGVPGELHLGGVGVARGYLNRPELTAEKFIPIPFVNSRGAEEPGSAGDFSLPQPKVAHPFTPATEGRPPLHPDSTGRAISAAGGPTVTSNSWGAATTR